MMPLRSATLVILLLAWSGAAMAADPVKLTLKDHRFSPDTVKVPAGSRIKVEITNQDATPAEFESSDLKAEKIIVPGGTISVFVGPLKPGSYKFFDDYHPEVATGSMIAVENLAAAE